MLLRSYPCFVSLVVRLVYWFVSDYIYCIFRCFTDYVIYWCLGMQNHLAFCLSNWKVETLICNSLLRGLPLPTAEDWENHFYYEKISLKLLFNCIPTFCIIISYTCDSAVVVTCMAVFYIGQEGEN